MTKEGLRYDKMVERALRGVVREAIACTAADGLSSGHHFYITFKTGAPGTEISDQLRMKYPDEMTIVLEHQFWDLTVTADAFAVTLSFNNRPERLVIPFAAITAFADPSVKFGLQFQESLPASAGGEPGLRLAEKADSAQAPRGGNARTPARLLDEKPPPERPTDKKPAGGKAAAKKPGEVVTLDTFRKK
jgi:uncharacterized protein